MGISNIFLIMLENHDWSTISGVTNCPFINHTLLPRASTATEYFTPTDNHPSEPNYIWLVAGTNFGILNDDAPSANLKDTTNHLAFLLDRAGIPWRAYQEHITGKDIPLVNKYPYAVRHNPFMFFKNITSNFSDVTNHIRSYADFAGDLANNRIGRFNFITPGVTNDMHDSIGGTSTRVQGDNWLAKEVPKLLNSAAFTNGGVLFIAWDEGSPAGNGVEKDGPLGLIVLSPAAKGHGYTNIIRYTHSSTLRTFQDILGVRPYLGGAAAANDLSDLFMPVPRLKFSYYTGDLWVLTASNVLLGRSYSLEVSSTLESHSWQKIASQIASTSTLRFTNTISGSNGFGFWRLVAQQ